MKACATSGPFLPGRPPAHPQGAFGKAGQRESRTECKLISLLLPYYNVMKYECMFLEGEMSSQKLNYSVNDTLSSANVEFFWRH